MFKIRFKKERNSFPSFFVLFLKAIIRMRTFKRYIYTHLKMAFSFVNVT